jgi:hypothetical protein
MRIVKLELQNVLNNVHLFNSGPHPPDSLLTTLPALGVRGSAPAWLTDYGFWYPFIMETQQVHRVRVRTVNFSSMYSWVLLEASGATRTTGKVPELYKQELLDPGVFKTLFRQYCPPRGYFVRLGAASVKDGVHAPRGLMSPMDVVEHLSTSDRALNAIRDCLHASQSVLVYFVPFDPSFDSRLEYRCFSCPISPICHTPKVTAISQYRWAAQGYINRHTETFFSHVLSLVQNMHRNILEYARCWSPNIARGLHEHGFVFDIRCLYGGQVQLVGLNSFGIASSCGSALFNWLYDAELLYGGKDDVEIRVVC